jgi:hypothetical protein
MYHYSFVGPPSTRHEGMDVGYRWYFIKHQSVLLILGDKTFAATLEKLPPSH